MRSSTGKYGLLLLIFFLPYYSIAQEAGLSDIDSMIVTGNFSKAQELLNNKVKNFAAANLPDSLVACIFTVGKLHAAQGKVPAGNQAVSLLIMQIKSLRPLDSTLRQAYIEAGEYYGYTGNNKKGYEQNVIAYDYAQRAKSSPSHLALIQNNLSVYAQRMGNIVLSKTHSLTAIHLLENEKEPDYIALYRAQNGLGSMMYYSANLDSAVYYFEAAIHSLNKVSATDLNRYYRMAILQNNLAGIYNQQGNSQKAINAMYATIGNLEKFNQSNTESSKKESALSFQFEATDNLSGIYKGLGNLSRAKDLLEFSYAQKQKYLPSGNPAIFISQILLGQLYYALLEHDAAKENIIKGLENYKHSGSPDPMWMGDGYTTLALICEVKQDRKQAEAYYNQADSCYRLSLGDNYDEVYLEMLRSKAQFLAESGKYEAAKNVASRSYHYVLKAQGKESLEAFYQLLNFSAIEYLSGNYKEARDYATSGLHFLNQKIKNAQTLMDSVKMETFKPKAILYQSRASYKLQPKKSVEEIKQVLTGLYDAIEIIERKKSLVNDPENNRIILSESKEIFDFVKSLEIELYQLTGESGYIDKIMNLQESSLYSRIRSRLNMDSIGFSGVPLSVQQEEKRLNNVLKNTLEVAKDDNALKDFIKISQQINDFRASLKAHYPKYYKLRYESFLLKDMEISKLLKDGTTLLRYFFIDSSLYVLVADKEGGNLVSLNARDLKSNIEQVNLQLSEVKPVSEALYFLYERLWKPAAPFIKNKNIVVIPDGVLFSLNMEVLTSERIHSFSELAQKSLLADYTFSYQYSMLLMNDHIDSQHYREFFSGFAPGFSDDVKNNYRKIIRDSVQADYGYLSLLPQPFTTVLVKKIKGLWGGQIFLDSDCTKERFIRQAGNSRIIHVGTHAFSDNQFPQYSRLIFSKDKEGTTDNALYVHELYHYNLPSALTVLSACETGRPGYEDGEGMISIGQAFHYAGCKSILTSLWKIDEKSSALILDQFYKNLQQGMNKDEALREAKLTYLTTERGRMLVPAYWAGLVVLGDTSPVLAPDQYQLSLVRWILGGLLIMGLTGYLIWRRYAGMKK